MKLSYASIALDQLGEVSVQTQNIRYEPPGAPNKEVRTISFVIDFWEQKFRGNYDLIEQVRDALKTQNGRLKWVDDTPEDYGEVYLDTIAQVVSHDLPENPNSWGVEYASISIVFNYEVTSGLNTDSLVATFKRTGAFGDPVTLGNVTDFKPEYRAKYFSEMLNLRDRATGLVTLKGEFLPASAALDSSQTQASKRTALKAMAAAMQAAVNGRDGTLTYGPSENRFFDQVVRVDSFTADVNQAVTGIVWNMSVSYTIFPNENGFASAEFKSAISEDFDTGEMSLTFSGRVRAHTDQIAIAKLEALKTAVMAANGFTISHLRKNDIDKQFINCDDSQTNDNGSARSGTDAPGSSNSSSIFTELNFNYVFSKRITNIINWQITVNSTDDVVSGQQHRTYSGFVIAGGATPDAAYFAAIAKARELGDNKHPIRVSGTLTRTDRQLNNGPVEHIRVEFSFEYRLKGERIYLETTSALTQEAFGDNQERVNGFVIAKDAATAQNAYMELIRNAYAEAMIRNEENSSSQVQVQNGTYGDTFSAGGGYSTLHNRFDFSFTAWRQKAEGFYSMKYAMLVSVDYVSCRVSTSVRGKFYGSPEILESVSSRQPGNKLDEQLAMLGLGKRVVRSERGQDRERIGEMEAIQSIDFSDEYINPLATQFQIVQCKLSERIKYAGTRWVFGKNPDGPSVPMACGTEEGARTVSGEIIASTEAAAMAWVEKQRLLSFPTGIGGGTVPAVRYTAPPEIERVWDDFMPLEEGVARGSGSNSPLVKITFTFSETLLNFQYVS